MDLETWLKIHTNISNFETASPKTTIWKKLRWKSLCLPILKSSYGFGGCCLEIRDVCMDFEPYFKVHSLIVSVHPKSIILGQMINLDMIFHVVVSVYRLVKIWNSPQFSVERHIECWAPRISWLGTFGLLVIFLRPQPCILVHCSLLITPEVKEWTDDL